MPEARTSGRGSLNGRRVLVAVSGGIAAYKTVDVVRRLLKRGADVRVMMTAAATRFLHPTTFAAITGHPVGLSLWDENGGAAVNHLELPHQSDLVLVAPATANLLAKMAHGIADDLVSTALLATTCPILVAPAMNPTMWEHPATRANLATLVERGVHTVGPGVGEMAAPGEKPGEGRMAEPDEIETVCVNLLAGDRPLSGRTVLITAGRTEEPIDRVRVITNRSSGRMGTEIAREALRLGARVILVHGGMDVAPPEGTEAIHAPSALEMLAAAREHAPAADLAFYVAAVSDWRPAHPHEGKYKREASESGALTLEFVTNPDIAATTSGLVNGPAIGFALEVDDDLDLARAKLRRKGLAAVLFNRDSNIGAASGGLTWVGPEEATPLESGSKTDLARQVMARAVRLLEARD